MSLQVSLGFHGNGREALEFYAKIFGFPMPQVMTYGEMPPDPAYPITEEVKQLIMYTNFEIMGVTCMLSDWPPEMAYVVGRNIGLMVVTRDADEIRRLYEALKEGGTVDMELAATFWSELYGMVTDKFGVQWQLNMCCDTP